MKHVTKRRLTKWRGEDRKWRSKRLRWPEDKWSWRCRIDKGQEARSCSHMDSIKISKSSRSRISPGQRVQDQQEIDRSSRLSEEIKQ